MTEQYLPCDINYDCGDEVVGDPKWYPWNNQNDTGTSGVTNNVMSLSIGGFRLFGENISEDTEVEVLPTSAASGTSAGAVTTGTGTYPSFTTTFTPASGVVPAYITVVPDAPIGDTNTYWIRGRNPGGSWVPAPVIILTGAG